MLGDVSLRGELLPLSGLPIDKGHGWRSWRRAQHHVVCVRAVSEASVLHCEQGVLQTTITLFWTGAAAIHALAQTDGVTDNNQGTSTSINDADEALSQQFSEGCLRRCAVLQQNLASLLQPDGDRARNLRKWGPTDAYFGQTNMPRASRSCLFPRFPAQTKR